MTITPRALFLSPALALALAVPAAAQSSNPEDATIEIKPMPDWSIREEVSRLDSSMRNYSSLIGSLSRASTDLGKELDELVRRYSGREVTLTPHLVQGQAHDEVNRLVGELGVDMVVMGTHGRTGLTRFLLGSVAERVVRTAVVPVLTVRGQGKAEDK